MKLSTLNAMFLTAAALGLATPALAHKAKGNHSHCSVAGKGVAVTGKTDAERKTACGKIEGSAWDANALPIEGKHQAGKAHKGKDAASAAPAAPAAPAAGEAPAADAPAVETAP